jgi:RNA polymerase primary sigma factor
MIHTQRPRQASPLDSYLGEINRTPLLRAEEEKTLAYRIENGDAEARDHLVRANLRLVVNIARSYTGKGLDLSDLVAEGNLGLLRAAEGFDPGMNTRFSTYATYWIRQSMKRALINTSKTVRIPAYMVQLLSDWRQASAALQEDLGRAPTEEEIAQRMKLSAKKLKVIKKAISIHQALPQGEHSDLESLFSEMTPDSRTMTADAIFANTEELEHILELVDGLEERKKAVLRLRFGLEGREPLTLQEIGQHLNLTRERVRQIEREALNELNEILLEE